MFRPQRPPRLRKTLFFRDLRTKFRKMVPGESYDELVTEASGVSMQSKQYKGVESIDVPTLDRTGMPITEQRPLGLVIPQNVRKISERILKEKTLAPGAGKWIGPKDYDKAVVSLYFAAEMLATEKGQRGTITRSLTEEELKQGKEPRGEKDVVASDRALVHGAGECVDISALFAAMARSVGIPTRIIKEKGGEHVYTEVWTPTSGWVHVGYRERILARPGTKIYDDLVEHFEKCTKLSDRSRRLMSLAEGLKKFELATPEQIEKVRKKAAELQ
jgi:hypothetical protein